MKPSSMFPEDFIWGSATSSYQIEGAALSDGKGPSIWDAFCMIPRKIHQSESGTIACDHYHRWQEDIELMKTMGLNAYRFSISWPRILPSGRTDDINMEGIRFYSDLIDGLLDAEITPWITLYHWDLPLALQLEMDGWLNADIADVFKNYAGVCFEYFGDRVKHWITINEAWVVAMLGYGQGIFAPGRISNSEPYLAAHNLLRAHAKAVHLYRNKYQSSQKGIIGITNNCDWREPASDSEKDKNAAERALEFFLGWFADPIYFGRYPESMIERVGERLPKFTAEDKAQIIGSSDFFGLNHYTTMMASESYGKLEEQNVYGNGGLAADQDVLLSVNPDWELTAMNWAIVSWGCRKLLNWIDQRYHHPDIYITENGAAFNDRIVKGRVDDQERIEFVKEYLSEIFNAIKNNIPVKGYFLWSLMDNFEWASGYSKRFGIHYVDFDTLDRIPKASAKWYAEVIRQNGF